MMKRLDSIGSQAELAAKQVQNNPSPMPEKSHTEGRSGSADGSANPERRYDEDSLSMRAELDEDDAYDDEVDASVSTQAHDEVDMEDVTGKRWQR